MAVEPSLFEYQGKGMANYMNRKYLSIMTGADHRAAVIELATAHRGVVEFESIIRTARGTPSRLHTNVKRIHKELESIRIGMQEVEARTLPGSGRTGSCWLAAVTVKPATAARRHSIVLTIDQHIRAARALGPAYLAVLRFLRIIGRRRHLSVRILDWAIRINHLIQYVRNQMEDLQFATLRGDDRFADCWLGHFNHFDGDEDGGQAGAPPARSRHLAGESDCGNPAVKK